MIPGEILPEPGDVELNAGLARTTLTVANTGDRPIQVGSHYHFAETNPALSFNRTAARRPRPGPARPSAAATTTSPKPIRRCRSIEPPRAANASTSPREPPFVSNLG